MNKCDRNSPLDCISNCVRIDPDPHNASLVCSSDGKFTVTTCYSNWITTSVRACFETHNQYKPCFEVDAQRASRSESSNGVLSMPLQFDLKTLEAKKEFFFSVFDSDNSSYREHHSFTFTSCNDDQTSVIGLRYIIIALCCALVLAFIFAALICLRKSSRPPFKLLRQANDSTMTSQNTLELQPAKTVLILFSRDHPKHLEVVLAFSAFLQNDLGFQVINELWEQNKVHSNYVGWAEESLNKADKVIIIWSPLGYSKWENINTTTEESVAYDFFVSMLKQIKIDLHRGASVGKIINAYFSYCSPDDIPADFQRYHPYNFKLCGGSDDDNLFSLLYDVEKYQRDGTAEFDMSSSDYGSVLQHSIAAMNEIANKDKDWFLTEDLENDNNQIDKTVSAATAPSFERSIDVNPPLDLSCYDDINNDVDGFVSDTFPLRETTSEDHRSLCYTDLLEISLPESCDDNPAQDGQHFFSLQNDLPVLSPNYKIGSGQECFVDKLSPPSNEEYQPHFFCSSNTTGSNDADLHCADSLTESFWIQTPVLCELDHTSDPFQRLSTLNSAV